MCIRDRGRACWWARGRACTCSGAGAAAWCAGTCTTGTVSYTHLPDHDNDIEKLKAAEPWLFGAGASTPAQTGATGLPNAGAASDEGAQMKRCRKIAGIEGDEE